MAVGAGDRRGHEAAIPVPGVLPTGAELCQVILEAIPDAVFLKDLEGRYLYINQAGAEDCRRPRHEILGRTDHDIFPRELADSLVAYDRATLAMGRAEVYQESVTRAGHTTDHLVTKTPCHAADGRIIGLIGVSKDITAGKRPAGLERTERDRFTDIIELQQAVGTATLEPREAMQQIVDRTLDLLGAEGAAILLAEDGGLVCHAASGCAVDRLGQRILSDGCPVGTCLRTGNSQYGGDAEAGNPGGLNVCGSAWCRPMMAVPLRDGATILGVLEVVAARAEFFDEATRQTVLLVGGLLSAALARAVAFDANRKLLEERTTTLAALRESEALLSSAMAAAQLGVWDWDIVSGRITWLGQHEAIFGLPPGGFDGRYETFLACVHPEDRQGVERAMTTALTSGAEYSHSHRVVWRDGSIHWILGRGQFHQDHDGQASRMYGAVMDVTDRRVLEHQVLQSQKIEAIGQLAAGIAHEINTPTQYVGDNLRFLQESFDGLLQVVVAYGEVVETARAAGLPVAVADAAWKLVDGPFILEEAPKAAAQARDGIDRVTSIVRAMKEFSHPDGDEQVLVDLNRAIENTIAVSRNEWKYLAELEFTPTPNLPPVPCRLGEIQQVVLNLIVNAAHAIGDVVDRGDEKGTITVSTALVDDIVEIRVNDSGTGIPPEVQGRIFDPFFTTKDVGRGTGQGLALARDFVVRKHRGTITFQTEMGKGTSFLVRLPLHVDDRLGVER